MKTITRETVFAALVAAESLEIEPNGTFYYLHLTEDGTPVPSFHDAAESFRCRVSYDRECPRIADFYERETEEDEGFMSVVDDLTAQANEWLARQ